jgi:hypothetical protein
MEPFQHSNILLASTDFDATRETDKFFELNQGLNIGRIKFTDLCMVIDFASTRPVPFALSVGFTLKDAFGSPYFTWRVVPCIVQPNTTQLYYNTRYYFKCKKWKAEEFVCDSLFFQTKTMNGVTIPAEIKCYNLNPTWYSQLANKKSLINYGQFPYHQNNSI